MAVFIYIMYFLSKWHVLIHYSAADITLIIGGSVSEPHTWEINDNICLCMYCLCLHAHNWIPVSYCLVVTPCSLLCPPPFRRTSCTGLFYLHYTPPVATRADLRSAVHARVSVHVLKVYVHVHMYFVFQACRK